MVMETRYKVDEVVQNKIFNGVMLARRRIDRDNSYVSISIDSTEHGEWFREKCSSFGPLKYDGEIRFTNMGKVSGWIDRWTDGGYTVIPDNLTLTPEAAAVWFYHRGSKDSHGRVYLSIHPPAVNLERAKNILESAGFGSFVSSIDRGGSVVITEFDSEDFLSWIEPYYNHP
jgi:hypothetical protein